MHVRLLVGVNSAAYNAIFMPAPSAVLEIDAKMGGYYKGLYSRGPQDFLTFHLGYHWIGIHLYLYTLDRYKKPNWDSHIRMPVNVAQRALSAMQHKLQLQETVGCCEAASLHREECRGTWQVVSEAVNITVQSLGGDLMHLDIVDAHNPASVSLQVSRFCHDFEKRVECSDSIMKAVEQKIGQSARAVSSQSGAVKALQVFKKHGLYHTSPHPCTDLYRRV
jgi:hypothetical protein